MSNEIKYAGENPIKRLMSKCKASFASLVHTHSWNDLEDKPFYTESDILYKDYPEYSFGYAKLPFILKAGVTYKIGYYNDNTSVTGSTHTTAESDGVIKIEYVDSDGRGSFRLEYVEGDTYSYFYPDGTVYHEGCPESSEDGSYAYTSTVKLLVMYINEEDVGVFTIDEKYIPDTIARVDDLDAHLLDKENPHEVSYDQLVEKPFGIIEGVPTNILTYDGDSTGYDTVTSTDGTQIYVKIADEAPSVAELVGTVVITNTSLTYTVTETNVTTLDSGDYTTFNTLIVGVFSDSCAAVDDYGEFTKGLWIRGNASAYIASLTATSSIFSTPDTIHKLDEKYIPDTITRVEDIPESKAIILSSSTEGSTKRFKITVDDEGILTATEIVEEATA